jgi:hypothetical protein
MNKYQIRFNQTRGQEGRGSLQHVWRVFENDKEFIFKNVILNVPSYGEEGPPGNWNICCHGIMEIDKTTSTAIINNPNVLTEE